MKIHGPNQTNFNPYKNHIQKQQEYKKDSNKLDQLEISNQAKKLQENSQPSAERSKYVQDIKKAVESGEYQVNPEKAAQKMIAFWSKHR
ncbi:flagellar biosynthesis anti-sigma factor FlgM [Lentibacillus sp. Marseille-P4043]|uniref:flagellar biosynthesis anti-sigma factor FlgM n=1 Tax=Lentibacillus sp. Marseille-P4043 TaxID=2040293 RepID=UPI000D0ADE00|nr:flagellar biosynthesis anti-sigma factor FlgM [Lentibacillus sp. Marseille-P4043]